MPNLEKLIKIIKAEKKGIDENKGVNTFEGKTNLIISNYVFTNQILKVAKNCLKTENVMETTRTLFPKSAFNFETISDLIYYTKADLKTKKTNEKITKTLEERAKICLERYDKSRKMPEDLDFLFYGFFGGFDDEEDKIISDSLKTVAPNVLVKACEKMEPELLGNELLDSLNGVKLLNSVKTVNIIPDDDFISTPTELDDKKILNEQIEEYKNLDRSKSDKELLNLLDEVNNLIIEGNPNSLHFQNMMAENGAVGASFEKKEILLKNLSAKERSLYKDNDKMHFPQLKDDSLEGAITRLNTFDFDYARLSENTQEQILEVGRKMEESGIISNYPFVEESGLKDYSFQAFIQERKNFINALNDGDVNKVKASAKKLVKLDKVHSEINDTLRNLNSLDNVDTNVSSSRNANVPFKYRDDFIATSRTNGVFLAKTYAKQYNVKFEDLVKNPFKAYLDGAQNLKQNGALANYFKSYSNNLGELLQNIEDPTRDPEFIKASRKDDSYFRGAPRVLDCFASLESDSDARHKFEYTSSGIYLYYGSLECNNVASILYNIKNDKKGLLTNLLVAKGNNMSPYVFSPNVNKTINFETKQFNKAFDRIDAIKHTDVKDILDGMIQLKDFNSTHFTSEDIKDALKTTAKDVNSASVKMTKNDKHLIKYFKKGKKIPNQFVENYKNEKLLNEIKANGISNIDSVIKNIAKNQNEYSNVSLWNKIFHSEYRDQNNIAQQMMDELVAKTGNKDAIVEMVNLAKEGNTNDHRYRELLSSLQNDVQGYALDENLQQNLSEVFDEKNINLGNEVVADNSNNHDLIIDEKEVGMN